MYEGFRTQTQRDGETYARVKGFRGFRGLGVWRCLWLGETSVSLTLFHGETMGALP